MSDEKKEEFLQRWSRRKHEERNAPPAKAETPAPALPPLDKLTPESDFTGFMHPKVEDALRRVALKKLFSDPHFNVPDPFEPYSRDWNISDPISEEMLAGLEQWKTMLKEPPKEAVAGEKAKEAEPAPAEETAKKSDEPGRQDA
jgi:hypothetical protein